MKDKSIIPSKSYLELFGQMGITFSFLEHTFRGFVSELIDEEDVKKAYIIINKHMIQSLINLANELIEHKTKNKRILIKYKELIIDFKKVIKQRNNIIHSLHIDYGTPNEYELFACDTNKQLYGEQFKINSNKIDRLIQDISSVISKLIMFKAILAKAKILKWKNLFTNIKKIRLQQKRYKLK